MRRAILVLSISLVAVSYFNASFAHGWIADPPARQELCYQEQGFYWPTDGSGIPDAACRAAYQAFGNRNSSIFIQRNEYAVNIPDYSNQETVEQAVPDGFLCSGQARYRGMSIAHPDWQKTAMPENGGTYTLKYRATAPHNPSYFEVYISKPDFDSATQSLAWHDLVPLGTFRDPALRNGHYEMDISLPSDRTKGSSAIIFVRWQRIDTVGEGFYNCSDIVFSNDATPTPPTNPPTPPTNPPTPPTPPTNPPTPPIPPTNPPTPPTNPPTPPTNPPTPPSTGNLNVQFTTQIRWDVGFNGLILITNQGAPIDSWSLTFKLAGNARVSGTAWGAAGNITHHNDGSVTITPNHWGGATIATGQTIQIYYNGLGQHQGAERCTLNNQPCTLTSP